MASTNEQMTAMEGPTCSSLKKYANMAPPKDVTESPPSGSPTPQPEREESAPPPPPESAPAKDESESPKKTVKAAGAPRRRGSSFIPGGSAMGGMAGLSGLSGLSQFSAAYSANGGGAGYGAPGASPYGGAPPSYKMSGGAGGDDDEEDDEELLVGFPGRPNNDDDYQKPTTKKMGGDSVPATMRMGGGAPPTMKMGQINNGPVNIRMGGISDDDGCKSPASVKMGGTSDDECKPVSMKMGEGAITKTSIAAKPADDASTGSQGQSSPKTNGTNNSGSTADTPTNAAGATPSRAVPDVNEAARIAAKIKANVQRKSEAQRLEERIASYAAAPPEHRPLVGGFAAAAYEAARDHHYKSQGRMRPEPGRSKNRPLPPSI